MSLRIIPVFCGYIYLIFFLFWAIPGAQAAPPTPEPQPIESDRLALPVLPDNPSQIDLGNYSYYYNCMPCHGDQGQGLTEEFRNLWVEDHRNCWARGCHAGRPKDEGFPIPRYIPGVKHLARFKDQQALYQYLKATHPPQRPGRLTDEEYWSLTVLLFYQAGRLTPDLVVESTSRSETQIYMDMPDMRPTLLVLATLVGVLIITPMALTRQANHKQT